MKIRKAKAKDLKEIVGLLHEYDLYESKLNKGYKLEKIKDIMSFNKKLMANPKVAYFVIDDGKRLLGVTSGEWRNSADGKNALFHNIFISKELRGEGYGEKLLGELERYFKKKGCNKIQSFVFGGNKKVAGFYKKRDYSVEPGLWIQKKL